MWKCRSHCRVGFLKAVQESWSYILRKWIHQHLDILFTDVSIKQSTESIVSNAANSYKKQGNSSNCSTSFCRAKILKLNRKSDHNLVDLWNCLAEPSQWCKLFWSVWWLPSSVYISNLILRQPLPVTIFQRGKPGGNLEPHFSFLFIQSWLYHRDITIL